MSAPEPYEKRALRHAGVWTIGPADLKVYVLKADPEQVTFVDDALKAGRRNVAGIIGRAKGDGRIVGFVISHHGKDANWLMLFWWEGDLLRNVTWRADLSTPTSFTRAEPTVFACAWELAVVGQERQAYVDTMMKLTPDRAAYLNRVAPNGMV